MVLPLILAALSGVTVVLGGPWFTWLPPLVLAGAFAGFFISYSPRVRQAGHRLAAWLTNPFLQWGALMAAGIGLVAWCVFPTSPPPSRADSPYEAVAQRVAASLHEVSSPAAWTDRGRRVRLLSVPQHVLPRTTLETFERDMAKEWGLSLRLVRTSSPDGRADCHGWVFADGRWWVLGQDVEVILQDNGYRAVAITQAGDLVVYRDGSGRIAHSGVVVTSPGGSVLVESKWSWLGSYVHAPTAQPYGGVPVFYRSARTGHRLTLKPTSDEPTPWRLTEESPSHH
jgi:hypothetical protein